jgi:hypothetical protein
MSNPMRRAGEMAIDLKIGIVRILKVDCLLAIKTEGQPQQQSAVCG